jgi:hypothetical protein
MKRPFQKRSAKCDREVAVPAVGKNLARAPDRRAGTSRLTTLAIETDPQTFSEVIPIASSLFRLH